MLVEWKDYPTPPWEPRAALYDKQGRCLCPTVLAEWISFQAQLKGTAGVAPACRVRVALGDRHEVTEVQLAGHSAFLASKARSVGTARSYCRLWGDVAGPFCRLFDYDPWNLTGMQIANLLVMSGDDRESA